MAYFRVFHASLILKQRGGEVGIWDLTKGKWRRKPWTKSTIEAHAALRDLRTRLYEKETR